MPKLPRHYRAALPALRPLSALLALGVLTACTAPVTLALGGASVISVAQTGKTIPDHAMSAATGMDCSIRNSLSGGSWCQAALNDTPDPAAGLVCYRSIADVTCYSHDNPHETASQRTQ